MKNYKIWDIYTRIFHWLFAPSVIIAIISGINSNLEVHILIVKLLVFLLTFRIIWGIMGYKTAQFMYFIKGFSAIKSYLKTGKSGVGHNPLGALSVVAMLGAVLLQLVSGLFTTDEVLFEAPWYKFAGVYQELLQEFHTTFFIILIILIITHLLAILVYTLRGKRLVKDMINGGKTYNIFTIKYIHFKALIVAIIAAFVVYSIFY
jgi:cytochrome b